MSSTCISTSWQNEIKHFSDSPCCVALSPHTSPRLHYRACFVLSQLIPQLQTRFPESWCWWIWSHSDTQVMIQIPFQYWCQFILIHQIWGFYGSEDLDCGLVCYSNLVPCARQLDVTTLESSSFFGRNLIEKKKLHKYSIVCKCNLKFQLTAQTQCHLNLGIQNTLSIRY